MTTKQKQQYLQDYNSKINDRNATTYLTKETFDKLAAFYKENKMDIVKAFEGDDVELV